MAWLPFFGGLVVTLPCDREAALAALEAAIRSARRQVLATALVSLLVLAVALGFFAALAAPFSLLGGVGAVFALLFAVFAALVPLLVYAQLGPWISYLEELRRGIEEGRVRVEDVCGRPLGLLGGPYGGPG